MEYTKAIHLAKSHVKRFPLDADGWRTLALAYDQRAASGVRRGSAANVDQKKAQAAVLCGLQHEPQNPELLHVKGIIHLHRRESKKALSCFRRAYHLGNDPRYLISIGNALRQLHRYTEAIRFYQKAKKFRTLSKAVIQNNIAQTYLEKKNLVAAVTAARSGLAVLKRKKPSPFEKIIRQKLIEIIKPTMR